MTVKVAGLDKDNLFEPQHFLVEIWCEARRVFWRFALSGDGAKCDGKGPFLCSEEAIARQCQCKSYDHWRIECLPSVHDADAFDAWGIQWGSIFHQFTTICRIETAKWDIHRLVCCAIWRILWWQLKVAFPWDGRLLAARVGIPREQCIFENQRISLLCEVISSLAM